jgi:hypothetical protein
MYVCCHKNINLEYYYSSRGRYISVATSVSHSIYYVCVDDYGAGTGKTCEVNIDECASSPCLNNATCLDQGRTYLTFTSDLLMRYIHITSAIH